MLKLFIPRDCRKRRKRKKIDDYGRQDWEGIKTKGKRRNQSVSLSFVSPCKPKAKHSVSFDSLGRWDNMGADSWGNISKITKKVVLDKWLEKIRCRLDRHCKSVDSSGRETSTNTTNTTGPVNNGRNNNTLISLPGHARDLLRLSGHGKGGSLDLFYMTRTRTVYFPSF